MSTLYLSKLRECGIDKGQTIAIAVCKCIGTLTPTIYGTPEGNRFIPVTDGICFVWDVIYIVELKKVGKREKARAIPHNSKCRYGERGAAAAKPKAQIILCVLSSILATQMPCRSCRSGA